MKKAIIFNLFSRKDNPLSNLLNEKMDAITSLSLVEYIEKFEKEFWQIEKVRQKLLKDIFEVDEKTWKILDLDNQEKMKKFTDELNSILNQDIDIKKIVIPVKDIKISPKDIILLKDIIEFKK